MKFRMDLNCWEAAPCGFLNGKIYEAFKEGEEWFFNDDANCARRCKYLKGVEYGEPPTPYEVKDDLPERLRNHFKGTAFEEVIERIIKDEI